MNATDCRAWLLPIAPEAYVAVGEGEIAHILSGWLSLHPVPRSPRWCHDVFLWQRQVVPLFDLGILVRHESAVSVAGGQVIMIVAYAAATGDVRFGGLRLGGLPFSRKVTDDQICDYPSNYDGWEHIAISCFTDPSHGPVPVLDLARLFDGSVAVTGRE
ncbi:MAG TPA: chemotaxis protein CheW [Gammaproteobacteria bacterium]|nr:chemotaxis protein CheW [Gammaproteobacteria bacterium]